ncbi:hypothetical protein C9374_014090 [Naegleria lovaniensis]|uniref:Uncharacterized protein n=1 Tax=Naegleria lovaniensis TaxID=51637 RepID=A0AA88KN04_NAELO|nr:uncharacterized protein C9374_014090 [Naegleria lovaniensis]KAG2389530.1 hypothetical protein C9374_014090 [Naegleria lovaniensis]
MKAPCPNKEGHSLPSIRKVIRYSVEKPLMLQSCFSQFYAGHTITNFVLYPYGKESHFLKIRELAFRNLKILPYDTKHQTKKEKRQRMKHFMSTKDIVIAIHRKGASSRHGQALANVDELARYFQTHLSNHSFIQQLLNSSNSNNHHSQQQMHRKLKIQVIELHQFNTIASQIEYFSQVDIYISDPGSAAYYAIFMRDETMMILPPTCHSETKQCRISHGTFVLSALPNVQVVEMMEMLLKGVSPECVPKALPMNPYNCEVIMPPPLLANAIVRALRRRFRKFVNNV